MFPCTICDMRFKSKSGYYKHFRIKHKTNHKDKNTTYTCYNCHKTFSNKKHLICHLKDEIQIIRNVNYKHKCSFENCNETFRLMKTYKIHLEIAHEVNITHNTFKFNTMEEFNKWKSDVEEKEFCQFVKKTSKKQFYDRCYIYYYCHRSFDPRTSNNLKKSSKFGGSVKIGHVCPSTIAVCIETSEITVNYCSTHLWHSFEIEKQRLPVEERKKIADKLSIGVSIDQIIQEIYSSVKQEKIKRIHLIQRKDIYNIIRDYKIPYSIKRRDRCLICHLNKCICNITDIKVKTESQPTTTSNNIQTTNSIITPAYSNQLLVDHNELIEVIYENQNDDNNDDSKLVPVDNVYCNGTVNYDQNYYNSLISHKMEIIANAYKYSNLNEEDLKNVLKYCDKILEIYINSTNNMN